MTTKHRLLRASAGTGKTYQLVKAYVDLIHEGMRPHEIVAITFTKKAAAELKTRIRKELHALKAPHATLSELNTSPISNFHGLALLLLRQAGAGLGLTRLPTIMGEQGEDKELFLDACETAWFAGDANVQNAVRTLAPYFSIDARLPEELWSALSRARENGMLVNASLIEATTSLEGMVDALLGSYDPAACRAELHQRLLDLRERLALTLPLQTEVGRQKIERFLSAPPPDAGATFAQWAAHWHAAGLVLDRKGKLGDVLSKADVELLRHEIFQVDVEAMCQTLSPSLRTLIVAAWQAYADAKSNHACVDFGDLVEQAVHMLSTSREAHERVRSRVRAVLVDEAQDTNRLQRRFVRLLAGFDGPAGRDQPGLPDEARLFVVGDRKQAIYTFRGADPASFDAFVADIAHEGGSQDLLSISRRSTPSVVNAINHLGHALFSEAYEPLVAADAIDANLEPSALWIEMPTCEVDEDATLIEAQAVASYVRKQVDSGMSAGDFALLMATMPRARLYARAFTDAGIDVVLGGGGGLYEQAEVIDVIALMRWLTNSHDRLAAAIALRSPLLGLSDAALLLLLQTTHGVDGLSLVRQGQIERFAHFARFEAMGCRSQLIDLNTRVPQWIAASNSMGPAQLLLYLERELHIRALYLMQSGPEQRFANCDKLVELARQFEQTQGGSTARFAHEISTRIDQGHSEPMAAISARMRNAVSIMSVHQSKGLQFPIVLLASLNRRSRNETSRVRYQAEVGIVFKPGRKGDDAHDSRRFRDALQRAQVETDAERRRLLYVAVTRAERGIVFFGPPAGQGGAQEGFSAYLSPWKSSAAAAGVLRVIDGSPLVRSDASRDVKPRHDPSLNEARAWIQSALPKPPPANTQFTLSIDKLLQHAQRTKMPTSGTASDALSQRIARRVLAALACFSTGDSATQFVDGELRRVGIDAASMRFRSTREELVNFVQSEFVQRMARVPMHLRRHDLPFQLNFTVGSYRAVVAGHIDLLFSDGEGPIIVEYVDDPCALPMEVATLKRDLCALAVSRLLTSPESAAFTHGIRTLRVAWQKPYAPEASVISPASLSHVEPYVVEMLRHMAHLRMSSGVGESPRVLTHAP